MTSPASVGAMIARGGALAFVLLLVLSVEGVAAGDQLIGIGGPYWSGRLAATTVPACVRTSTSASAACELFPAGGGGPNAWQTYNYPVITFSAAGRCAFSCSPTPSITGMGVGATGTDTGGTGPAAMVSGVAGSTRYVRPNWANISTLAGGRPGICTTAIAGSKFQEPIFMPCAVTGDCGSYGTCATSRCVAPSTTGCITEAMADGVGVFLHCVADATANIDVSKERTRK